MNLRVAFPIIALFFLILSGCDATGPSAVSSESDAGPALSNSHGTPSLSGSVSSGTRFDPPSPDLSWNSSYGAVEYEVYSRTPADNSFKYLATTTSTSYLDNSVNSCNLTVGPAPSSQEISYKVRGVDSNGTKGHFSNVVNYDFGNGGCPGASY